MMFSLNGACIRPQFLQQQPRGSKQTSSRGAPPLSTQRTNTVTTTCSLKSHQEGEYEVSRRAMMTLAACITATSGVMPANAVGFQKELKKRKIALDEYSALPSFEWKGAPHDGLKIYELVEGTGAKIEKGSSIVVHYDCKYKGLVAVSSREARLLGGNRTIAEPFQFTYGKIPQEYTREVRKDFFTGVGIKVSKDPDTGIYYVDALTKGAPAFGSGIAPNDKLIAIDGKQIRDLPTSQVGKMLLGDEDTEVALTILPAGSAETEEKVYTLKRATYAVKAKVQAPMLTEGGGGLYAGPSGPKPPAALYLALDGMKVGGKRSILVPADVGYGEDGNNEIPPDASNFVMEVELLDVKAKA
eukprot:CAMPEP_0118933050 /NCGR_PEP_ID=MMETSP1169-20130426/11105_1 /TAXON_ID=36882 /ORGANISM="Pyramimonas obovata, Strain CCMP722" /LENGTH=356 /DNA_ID=CAMNT_0006875769 /DNA_START=45 /DNA_END=1115 /DNA_ORIENTATION=+